MGWERRLISEEGCPGITLIRVDVGKLMLWDILVYAELTSCEI